MTLPMRNIVLAAILVMIGLAAGSAYLGARTRTIEAGNEYVRVLVATGDITEGTSVSELQERGLVEKRRVLRADAVSGALSELDADGDRVVRSEIFAGDQLTARKLTTSANVSASARITGTARQMSLPIANWHAVNGQVQPGDRVDLFSAFRRRDTAFVRIAARDVEVVAVPPAQAAGRGAGGNAARPAFTFVIPDELVPRVLWAYTASEGEGLHLALIPSEGASESVLADPTVSAGSWAK